MYVFPQVLPSVVQNTAQSNKIEQSFVQFLGETEKASKGGDSALVHGKQNGTSIAPDNGEAQFVRDFLRKSLGSLVTGWDLGCYSAMFDDQLSKVLLPDSILDPFVKNIVKQNYEKQEGFRAQQCRSGEKAVELYKGVVGLVEKG